MVQASSGSERFQSTARKKTAVAFDSSFLIAVMERPTPWMEDITGEVGAFIPVVLTSVRDELSRLAAKENKTGRSAGLALELLRQGRFSLMRDGGGKPDDEIVSFALRGGARVATIDSDLVERLRACRVQTIITLRGGRVST